MSKVSEPPPSATEPTETPHLDWRDPLVVRRFLADLRVAITDVEAVTEDMLRPLRRRRLGPAECRRLYRDAASKTRALLAYADPGGGPED